MKNKTRAKGSLPRLGSSVSWRKESGRPKELVPSAPKLTCGFHGGSRKPAHALAHELLCSPSESAEIGGPVCLGRLKSAWLWGQGEWRPVWAPGAPWEGRHLPLVWSEAPSGTGEAAPMRSVLWALSSTASTPSLSPGGLWAIAVSCQGRESSRRCLRAKPALAPLDVGPTSGGAACNALAPRLLQRPLTPGSLAPTCPCGFLDGHT